MEYDFSDVWDATLKIFVQFQSICEQYGLRYFAAYGTAIGAVRHNGFIPWDDDLDVYMPQPDYERLLEIAETVFPENIKLVTHENTPEFLFGFAKVQNIDCSVVERIESKTGHTLANGIFIDVFPLYGAPSGLRLRLWKLQQWALACYRRYRFSNYSIYIWKGKLLWIAGWMMSIFFSKIVDEQSYWEYSVKFIRKYKYGTTKNTVAQLTDPVEVAPIYPVSSWERPPVYFNFMNIKMPVSTNFDSVLRSDYGDYMKLPPIGSRFPYHVSMDEKRRPWWIGPTNKNARNGD